ncbi:MAG: HNH endonuclease signature motif containing protein [Pseudonocardia sp.]
MDARRADLLVALLTGRVTLDDGQDPRGGENTGGDAAPAAVPVPAAASGPVVAADPAMPPAVVPAEPARPARERVRPVTPGRPLVHVVVPYSTLTGADDQPCELAGYGPVPAGLARDIAADAVWRRLVTDPLSGALLDHGRTTYHPPAALADHVRARDHHCRGPRCRRPATTAELDHHVPFPHGPTAESNLAALCKHHHDLKHHGGWQVHATPTGHWSGSPRPVTVMSPGPTTTAPTPSTSNTACPTPNPTHHRHHPPTPTTTHHPSECLRRRRKCRPVSADDPLRRSVCTRSPGPAARTCARWMHLRAMSARPSVMLAEPLDGRPRSADPAFAIG